MIRVPTMVVFMQWWCMLSAILGHTEVLGPLSEHWLFQTASHIEWPWCLYAIEKYHNSRCIIHGKNISKETDLRKCIPIIVHGDDAESHRRRSFMVTSWASLLTTNSSIWETRLLAYTLDNSRSCNETQDTMDAWMVWSLVELMTGRYLERGPWSEELPRRKDLGGKEIANGYRAILVAHRGDEKYLVKVYHMCISWLSRNCCWSCHASRIRGSPMLFTHFGPNAVHRTTMVDTTEFIQSTCTANAWVRLPGWHTEVLTYDFLHVFDLTLVPDAAASVFWLGFTKILMIPNVLWMHVRNVIQWSACDILYLRHLWSYLKLMKCGQA